MTMDKSLKISSKLSRRRNVLKRDERVVKLADDGRWTEEKGVFGLPKVKVVVHTPRKAEKQKPEEEAAAEAPAEK